MDIKKAIENVEFMIGENIIANETKQIRRIKIETLKIAMSAMEKHLPKNVTVKDNEYYFCPVCKKQQKNSHKNRSKGCYCERCGQYLVWE